MKVEDRPNPESRVSAFFFKYRVCLFSTSAEGSSSGSLTRHDKGTTAMKKLSLGMAVVLALLSIAGCAQYVGKGKAPPPVVTKG